MAKPAVALDPVFRSLKSILSKYEDVLAVKTDTAKCYYVETAEPVFRGRPLCFGAVKINKNYVSYHLVPVYMFPDLTANATPELKRRQQGKGCFNFKSVDPKLFAEVAKLTEAGYKRFRAVKDFSKLPASC